MCFVSTILNLFSNVVFYTKYFNRRIVKKEKVVKVRKQLQDHFSFVIDTQYRRTVHPKSSVSDDLLYNPSGVLATVPVPKGQNS